MSCSILALSFLLRVFRGVVCGGVWLFGAGFGPLRVYFLCREVGAMKICETSEILNLVEDLTEGSR